MAIREARNGCLEAIRIDEQLVPVHLTLARIAQRENKDYEQAIGSAQRAVALAPWSSDAYHELGMVREARAEWDAAEAVYKQALENLPDDSQAQGDLCRLYLGKGQRDSGKPFYSSLNQSAEGPSG